MTNISLIERIRGVRLETGAHQPFPLDDPARVYFVEQGYLDVFAVELSADEVAGRRRFVARASAGQMAFGCDRIAAPVRSERTFGFLAVPSLDAVLIVGERDGVASDNFDLEATNWIDEWISHLSEFLVRDRPPPRNALLLEADPDIPYSSGSALSAQHKDIIWVSANAPLRLVGHSDLTVAEGDPLQPITEHTWLEIDVDAQVSAVYTPTALLTERLWSGFDRFGARVLEFAVLAEVEEVETSAARRRSAHQARSASVTGALRGFGKILAPTEDDVPADATGRTPLQVAAALVATSCGASLEIPARPKRARGPTEEVEILAGKSGIRTRQIALTPGWWRRDGPSFVGFTAGENGREKPLAILADSRGAYRAVDPETDATFAVNRQTAAGIKPSGIAFYAPLPDRVEGGKEALRFSMHRRWRDLRTLLAVGILGGLAALLIPILTGQILVRMIPRADIPLWLAALGALLLVAFAQRGFRNRARNSPAATRGPDRRALADGHLEPVTLPTSTLFPQLHGRRPRKPGQRHQPNPPVADRSRHTGGDGEYLLGLQPDIAGLL